MATERSYPTNVVALDPEANALVLQIAAARAQLAQDVADKIRDDLDNFKIEVRESLLGATSRLDAATTKCDQISGRLVDRLAVLEGRALQRNSNEEIVVSLAETQIAEQRLELERGRQELEREREARFAETERARNSIMVKADERRAEIEERKAASERRWTLVKQWSTALTSGSVVLAVIALIAQKC